MRQLSAGPSISSVDDGEDVQSQTMVDGNETVEQADNEKVILSGTCTQERSSTNHEIPKSEALSNYEGPPSNKDISNENSGTNV